MNEPQNIVDEMLEGFVFAHEEIEWFPNYRVVALKEKKKGQSWHHVGRGKWS